MNLNLNSILILTPLKIELNYLLKGFEDLGHKSKILQIENRIFHHFESLPYFLTLGGHGKVNFAIQTFDSILKLQTKKSIEGVFCVGCAGSLKKEISEGHIVIGLTTIEHDYRTNFIKSPRPSFTASPKLIGLFDSLLQTDSQLHLGHIASGDEDISTQTRAQEIFELTKADAVAWEGIGGAKTCQLLNLPFLELRGITDNCVLNVDIDFKGRLKLAMDHCAKVLVQIAL